MTFPDDTNLEHPFQGTLRFARLDANALMKRCDKDAGQAFSLVLTHCDQLDASCAAEHCSTGPTREDIS